MKQNKLYNVAIYCRLSLDDGNEGDSSSIKTQKIMLEEYVKEKGFNIYDYYIDDGFSGLNFNRPAFKRMIKDIEAGFVNLVITKDLSRLGRDYIMTGYYNEIFFPSHDVRYISINDNVDRLIKVLKEYLPDNIKYFMDNETTTAEMDFRLSELVREKIFIHTNDEVPHSISCKLIGYEETKNIAKVYVDIIVDRDSLRNIIVGANGQMIKVIGREARLEMEEILGKKVYLELYCKTIKKWREKEKFIKDLGYLVNNE